MESKGKMLAFCHKAKPKRNITLTTVADRLVYFECADCSDIPKIIENLDEVVRSGVINSEYLYELSYKIGDKKEETIIVSMFKNDEQVIRSLFMSLFSNDQL
ncbi:hypothetical protein LBMAG25_19590 [Bacteroidota bacterium]|nr:hypothetical protein LBMAG25_19590 [Bacteroidota bacterium]